jgi:hypothetical protein
MNVGVAEMRTPMARRCSSHVVALVFALTIVTACTGGESSDSTNATATTSECSDCVVWDLRETTTPFSIGEKYPDIEVVMGAGDTAVYDGPKADQDLEVVFPSGRRMVFTEQVWANAEGFVNSERRRPISNVQDFGPLSSTVEGRDIDGFLDRLRSGAAERDLELDLEVNEPVFREFFERIQNDPDIERFAEKLTVRFPQDDGVVAVLEVVNFEAGDVLGTFTFEFIPVDAEPISCANVDGPPLGERCEALLESA